MADSFLRAPTAEVEKYIAELAVKRGYPAQRQNGRPWPCRLLMTPGDMRRITEGEAALKAAKPGEIWPGPWLLDASQNADRRSESAFANMTSQCPTLCRNTKPWSCRKKRWALPVEGLELQGWQVYGFPTQFSCPFIESFVKFPEGVAHGLVGNGMHVAAVTSVLAYTMSAVFVEPAALAPTALPPGPPQEHKQAEQATPQFEDAACHAGHTASSSTDVPAAAAPEEAQTPPQPE